MLSFSSTESAEAKGRAHVLTPAFISHFDHVNHSMQNLLEEETSHSPPPVVVALTQKQLAWTIAVVLVLLVLNLVSAKIIDSLARYRSGDEYYRLRVILDTTLLGLMHAQLPMAWIWLRMHVAARSFRLVFGWLIPSVVIASFNVSVVIFDRRAWDWEQLAVFGLMMYFLFLLTGWLINLFVFRCKLSHLWALSKRHSQFAIGDLLSVTFVAAMVMGEFMLIRESIPWPNLYALIPVSLVMGFPAIGAATIATLALGCFYSPKSVRFMWMFAVLVILGPTLVVGIPVLLRAVGIDALISTNAAIWTFAATLMLLFPTLPQVARLSQP